MKTSSRAQIAEISGAAQIDNMKAAMMHRVPWEREEMASPNSTHRAVMNTNTV